MFSNLFKWDAWQPAVLVASHSDVGNDIRFVMAAILIFIRRVMSNVGFHSTIAFPVFENVDVLKQNRRSMKHINKVTVYLRCSNIQLATAFILAKNDPLGGFGWTLYQSFKWTSK